MHKELRYLGKVKDIEKFIQYLYSTGNCLDYKVSNFYLDYNTNQYSQTSSNSPRFRLRLYEAEKLCFGNIELKYRLSENDYTYKDIWNIIPYWDNITALIPLLREKQLRLPEKDSAYQVLEASVNSQHVLVLNNISYVDALIYNRLSCNWGKSRITIDSYFSPLIVPENNIILEWKGEHDENIWQKIENHCVLKSISELSKFTLLAKSKK